MKQLLKFYIHGIYKIEVELSNGKTITSRYDATSIQFDVVKYCATKSMTPTQYGFEVKKSNNEGNYAGDNFYIGKWTGTGSFNGYLNITYEKLNRFNIDARGMEVEFDYYVVSPSNVISGFLVYYSDDDFDRVTTGTITSAAKWKPIKVTIEFRKDKPVQKVQFFTEGYDAYDAGVQSYIGKITLLNK